MAPTYLLLASGTRAETWPPDTADDDAASTIAREIDAHARASTDDGRFDMDVCPEGAFGGANG